MSSIEMHAMTDVGVKRDHNEDCVGITPSHGFAILADGMGGYNAGEVASSMAVDIITRSLKSKLQGIPQAEVSDDTGFTGESMLSREAIRAANDTIYNTARKKTECAGMGTTVLVAVFYADRISATHVGDSRMYRLRNNLLSHVTEDHSLIHEQVCRGLVTASDARNSMIKNLVTRALGLEPGVEADIIEDTVRVGDIYLMCSDGLTDVVSDETILLTLSKYKKNLQKAGEELIRLANEAGGPDNISLIMIRTAKTFPVKQSLFFRLLGRK
jgi:protein phosphatase